jgi:AbrB family transcriptional regulator (stage V sporulation protein T)
MKNTGIVRRVDVLGRVVVPKEIRKILKISEGDPLEIFTEKDWVILKKYSPLSDKDGLIPTVASALCRQTGKTVFICDKDVVLATSGYSHKEILATPISFELEKCIRENKTIISSFDEGGTPLKVIENDSFGFVNQLVMPIEGEEETYGAIILCDKVKENKISAGDIDLVRLACDVISDKQK